MTALRHTAWWLCLGATTIYCMSDLWKWVHITLSVGTVILSDEDVAYIIITAWHIVEVFRTNLLSLTVI